MIRCLKCKHPLGDWSRFAVDGRLTWHVHLSPRWAPRGDHWENTGRQHRWHDEGGDTTLPPGTIRDSDGIHLRPPVRLRCALCGTVREAATRP
jgi:hypothetical protein